jgi:putative tryptophan/tyrosine transport system substrate-binding protein
LLQLLKEIAPHLERAAVIYKPKAAPGCGLPFVHSIRTGARSIAIEVTNAPVRSLADVDHTMSALMRGSHAGVIVAPDVFNTVHRREIGSLALRYRLPTISDVSDIAVDGVLISYGPDLTVEFRQAAAYVNRILRGMKPADLPVQSPTAFDLTINLKTAKALGLTVPESLLVQANEVIR